MRTIAALVLCLFLCLALPPPAATQDRLTVHEWGTFTALQDEDGHAVAGINTEDEPVPRFVHRLAWRLVFPADALPAMRQGAPRAHPHVTLRLETPVVYFYPPSEEPLTLDVEVAFRGGWLTEYYPDAEGEAPGLAGFGSLFGPLTPDAVGTLRWQGLRVGTGAPGPATDARVWLAPRAVDAASVTTAAGESERYLFYRGVGRRPAPLRLVRNTDSDRLRLEPNPADRTAIGPSRFEDVWLVDVREDGRTAFTRLGLLDGGKGLETPASFAEDRYRRTNLDLLRRSMHDELVAEGLYADEAAALLETWKVSYFESPGTRLFFLVPRAWTDHVLPLAISRPAQVVRVMVGRIELVTPRHRAILRRLAAGVGPAPGGLHPKEQELSPDPRPAPPGYDLFLRLGRFRHVLLLDEQRRRPTAALDALLESYGIRYYTVDSAAPE